MAAITGLGAFSIISWTSNREGPREAPPNSVMSAPAMKVRPSQISTMALTAGSAVAALKPSNRPSRTLAERAFTGGEFRVMTAMSPSIERSVTGLMAVMRFLALRFPDRPFRGPVPASDSPGGVYAGPGTGESKLKQRPRSA